MYIYIYVLYTHNLPVCNYGSDFRCLLMCFIFFSFCFYSFFMWKTCLKVIAFSFLLLSAAKMLLKRANDWERDRQRERGRERENKTKTAISPLHDEAALSCCCFVSFAMAAASAKMKLIEFIIFYAFYMAPTKIKIRSRILLIYLIKKDPVCCFYYCYLYFYFFITYNKSAEFAVLHNGICYSVTVLFTFARCVWRDRERERVFLTK